MRRIIVTSKVFNLEKITVIALTLLIGLGIFMANSNSVYASGNAYYVSNSGNDNNNGTSLSTPFRTIQKAATLAQAGDTVFIREGVYRETVTPANSGTQNNPIVYKNYNNETVTIKGTDPVGTSGWQVESGNIYKKANVYTPLALVDLQVFVDEEDMVLARWPNSNAKWNDAFSFFDSVGFGYVTDSGIPGNDDAWNGGVIQADAYGSWSFCGWEITDYIASQKKVVYSTMDWTSDYEYTWQFPGYCPDPSWGSDPGRKGFYLAGARVALDVSKEWYLDKNTNILYLYTPNGDNPENHSIEIKTRNEGFSLGTQQYITIQGLNFFACSVNAIDAQNIVIDDIVSKYGAINRVEYKGNAETFMAFRSNWKNYNAAIMLGSLKDHYGKFNTIKNSTVYSTNSPFVVVGGECSKIINNHFYDNLVNDGIILGGKSHLVSNNTIHDCAEVVFHGIYYNCIFQYNDIYRSNMLINHDNGVIHPYNYDLGNSEFHHNKVHDLNGTLVGFYFDNGTTNACVYKNAIYDIKNGNWNTAIMANFPYDFISIFNNTGYNTGSMGFNTWYSQKTPDTGYMAQGINNICSAQSFNKTNEGALYNNIHHETNPGYVDLEARNFRLLSGSSAKDNGLILDGITDGYSGMNPDIGCYEYGAADWSAGYNASNRPNPTFVSSNWPNKNLVYNAGFEAGIWGGSLGYSGFHGWTKGGANTAQLFEYSSNWSDCVETGRCSVRLNIGDSIEQTITGLLPNTTYTAAAYMRMDQPGSGSVVLSVDNYGGSIQNQPVTAHTKVPFPHPRVTFTTGPDATSATIRVSKDTEFINAAYVDDVSLIQGGIDLAGVLNRDDWVATASSSYMPDGRTPDKAIDGDTSTLWTTGSLQNDGQWFAIDMGSAKEFDKIVLDTSLHPGDAAAMFELYVSDDAIHWGDAIATGQGRSITEVTFNTQKKRYIKILQRGSKTFNWWTIEEIYVANVADISSSLSRTGWSIQAHASYNGYLPSLILDGEEETHWLSGSFQSNGDWVQIDMGATKTFNRIRLLSADNDYPRAYSIYVSNDGSNWGNIVSSGVGSSDITDIQFNQQIARYIKIVQTGNSNTNWWGINEFMVYQDKMTIPRPLRKDSWEVSSSSSYGGYPIYNALDSNVQTHWLSGVNQTNSDWVIVDMNRPMTFNKISLESSNSDYPRIFEVYTSIDGVNWGSVVISGTGKADTTVMEFNRRTARYIKIMQLGESTTNWWGINELTLYN